MKNKTTALIFLCLSIVLGCNDNLTKTAGNQPVENLDKHPIYKNYNFSQDKQVIDFGIQPLWMPTSFITEYMKRDRILHEELGRIGVKLVFHSFLKGNDVNYFLQKGDLELGIGGDMPVLRAAAENDLQIFALVQEGGVAIITKDIREIQKLKGEKIGYAFGSNAHFYLINTLMKYDVSLSEVDLVQMDVTEMPAALMTGKIAAFSAWEPTPAMAIIQDQGLICVHQGKSYGFLYGKKMLLDNPEAIKHILASEIRALNWMRANNANQIQLSQWSIDEGEKIKYDRFPLSARTVSELADRDLPGILGKKYPRIPDRALDDTGKLKREFDLLQQFVFIDKKRQWQDVRSKFNLELIEAVIEKYDKYKLHQSQLGN